MIRTIFLTENIDNILLNARKEHLLPESNEYHIYVSYDVSKSSEDNKEANKLRSYIENRFSSPVNVSTRSNNKNYYYLHKIDTVDTTLYMRIYIEPNMNQQQKLEKAKSIVEEALQDVFGEVNEAVEVFGEVFMGPFGAMAFKFN
ncbi:hypothetical protein ACPV3P_19385 [Photobacterium damselae]|uniref:hypothetical protein n=1 Tax=Photobacterium damselae TaxID=38293 RepID=UPI004068D8E4